jgi:prolyl-tRNA synthetase
LLIYPMIQNHRSGSSLPSSSCMMIALILSTLSRQAIGFHAATTTTTTAARLSRQLALRTISTQNLLPNRIHTTNNLRLLSTAADLTDEQKMEIEGKIKEKGDEIRARKDEGAEKSNIAPLVQELLALKAQLDPSILETKKPKEKQQQQQQQQQPQKKQQQKQQQGDDDAESDFITAREVDYSKWYTDVIRVTGLAEASPVRGCMVIKPWGMSIWDKIRTDLDVKIKEHGAENAYFPLLIPKSFLSKEAEHVDGFAKECAVVTHHRLKAGDEGGLIVDPEAELEEPLIIRPTSETMIWYHFRKWISSHRYDFV